MSLYNCKETGDNYRISKFTNDLEVEASYLTNGRECDCPAGFRPACRHRTMLPRFIAKNAISGRWFYNYEHQQWVRALTDETTIGEVEEDIASAASQVDEDDIEIFEPSARYADGSPLQAGINAKDVTPKPINLLALAEPLRFNKDHSNSVGHSPAHDALEPKPLRRL